MKIAPGIRLGDYEVVSRVGKGGMGAIYEARDLKLGRRVAIKVIREDQVADEEHRQRFQTEARAASALNHPNIITVYQIGQLEKTPYLVMEYIEGKTLRDVLERGALPIDRILDYAGQAVDGLAKAHSAGIVHRDLKPDNLMITNDGFLKILDFGLAKRLQVESEESVITVGKDLTQHGMIVGSAPYMSPEQASGKQVDFRSDQFSLGSILYELATGHKAFGRQTFIQSMSAVIEAEPRPMKELNSELPDQFISIVKRLLSKDPEQRYGSTDELVPEFKDLRVSLSRSTSGQSCARCGERNPPESQFCGRCGNPLRSESSVSDSLKAADPRPDSDAKVQLAGERREAIVVVCTLEDFAQLVEEWEPTALENSLRELSSSARKLAGDWGGFVQKSEGAETVVLFGVPVSHEDDALKAIGFALELKKSLESIHGGPSSTSFRLRSAVHQGSVVTRFKDDGELSVAGEALGITVRLAEFARAAEVLVTAEMQRLIDPFYKTEGAPAVPIPGNPEPLQSYRVLGPTGLKGRLEAAERRGLTPYVGREKELQILAECWEKTRGGEGQLVTIIGEAGVGKSRLLLEFRQRCVKDSVPFWIGKCQSSRASVPYVPFVSAMWTAFGIEGEQASPQTADKVIAAIRKVDPGLEDYVPLYLHLLALQDSRHPLPEHLRGDDLRFATNEALVAILAQASLRTPLIMVLENWQWSDEASREVLNQLLEIAPSLNLLTLVTHRPDASFGWAEHELHCTCFLKSLTLPATGEMVGSILGTRSLPSGLVELVHERTGGNPFFVEELCRSLREEGALDVGDDRVVVSGSLSQIRLPSTIQGVIRSRLDRLNRTTIEVLRCASVVGRDFSVGILAEMVRQIGASAKPGEQGVPEWMKEGLAEARASGLIEQTRLFPEAAYRFKNALTREVAYESLFPHRRRQLHKVVASALEKQFAEGRAAVLDLLAHHSMEACEWELALRYSRLLAEVNAQNGFFNEALAMLEKAVRILRKLPETDETGKALPEILFEMERFCETLGLHDRQQSLISQLTALFEQSDDQNGLAKVVLRQAELYALLKRFDEAEAVLQRGLSIERERSNLEGERDVLRSLAFLYWRQEKHEIAATLSEKSLQIDRQLGDPMAEAFDLNRLASPLRSLGRPQEALEKLREAIRLYEAAADLGERNTQQFFEVYAPALYNAGHVLRDLNRLDEALASYRKSLEVAGEHKLLLHRHFLLTAMAVVYWQQGRIEESLSLYEEAIDSCRALMNRRELSRALQNLGQRLISLGREREALDRVREAAEVFEQIGEVESASIMWMQTAEIYGCKDYERSLAALRRALRLRTESGNSKARVETLRAMGDLSREAESDPAAALDFYRQASQLAEEAGLSPLLGDLLNTMGILRWKQGDYASALELYERALAVFRGLEDRVHEGLILNSLAAVHQNLNRLQEARDYGEAALKVNRVSGEQLLESHSLALLGNVHERMDDAEQALYYYENSLEVRKALLDRSGEGWMLVRMAGVLESRGDTDGAREYRLQAVAIAEEISDPRLKEACYLN